MSSEQQTSTHPPRTGARTRRFWTALSAVAVLVVASAYGQKPADRNAEPLWKQMTPVDVEIADATVQRALENGRRRSRFTWRNPASEHAGAVRPVETYRTRAGHYCRRYRETLFVGTQSEIYQGTACRDRNGRWRVID